MNIDLFISYHTKSSLYITESIVNKLESCGIRCWYAPRNVVGEYAASIEKAINACRVFVVVLNSDAAKSYDVKSEINLAIERVRRHENIAILPFKVSEDDFVEGVRYYIGQQHWIDAVTPPLEAHIMTLVDTVKDCLSSDGQSSTKINRSVLVTNDQVAVVNSLAYPDSDFVGRNDELVKLNSILSGGNNKVFLVGMGGLGKSQIAKKYLQEHINEYKNIVWVSFEKNLACSIGNDNSCPMTGISRIYYPNDTDEEYGLRKMDILKRIADKNVLIIIDNFDVEDDPDLERFLSGSYSVIFTTRIQHSGRNEIPIEPINDETTLFELFFKDYKREVTPQDRITIKRIIDYLEGHTLSVRLVAGEMQNNRIRPEKMLGLLKKENADGRNINTKVSERIVSRIKSIFSLSVLSNDEKNLLMNLSLFPNSGIEVTKLYEWCGYEDYDIINGLISRSWIIYDVGSDTAHLHPIIAEIMLQELNKQPETCDTMLTNYYEQFKWNRPCSIKERVARYELARIIWERLPVQSAHQYDALLVKISTTTALSLYEATFEDCKNLLKNGTKLEHKIYGCEKYSHILCLSGHNAEAIKTAQAGRELIADMDFSSLSEYEYFLVKDLYERISEISDHLGDAETAYKTQLIVYKMVERDWSQSGVFSREGTLGWAEFHLTHCLYHLGRYDEALEMTYRSIKHFEECGSKWGMSFSFWLLAILLARQGKYDKAEAYIKQSLDNLISLLGHDNVDIAKTLHYQAHIRIYAHDAAGAVNSLEAARLIYEKLGFSVYVNIVDDELKRLKEGTFWEPDIYLVI